MHDDDRAGEDDEGLPPPPGERREESRSEPSPEPSVPGEREQTPGPRPQDAGSPEPSPDEAATEGEAEEQAEKAAEPAPSEGPEAEPAAEAAPGPAPEPEPEPRPSAAAAGTAEPRPSPPGDGPHRETPSPAEPPRAEPPEEAPSEEAPPGAAPPRRGGLQGLLAAVRGPLDGRPPPGPSRPEFWRSPLRGPWLTSVLGLVLLVGLVVVIVTGFLSYAAYNPGLAPINDKTANADLLGFYLFPWPTSPYWLYRLTQGLHVIVGLALIPVLLAKLWSVIPRLFAWPPVRSLNHALERVSLLFLVGGALFEVATGVLNIQLEYIFPGSFYPLHFYGAWVFVAALVVHVALRVGKIRRSLRGRSLREELRTPTAHTEPEEPDDSGLVSPAPARPTMSRRGLLAMTGAGSVVMLGVTVGQSIGGPLRETALLAPRGQELGSGPNGFQINKTAAARGIRERDVGPDWRLTVRGAERVTRLSRDELLRMPQHTAHLPIACVEGWSTGDQAWTGVRLADLAALAGHETDPPDVFVESLQLSGSFRAVAMRDNQVRDPRSLLALRVNGADLSMDHGFPARVIVPAAPGVMNTKWVTRLTFGFQGTEGSA